MTDTDRPDGAAHWSLAGLAVGARRSLPAMPVMAIFGLAFGAVAAQKGLSLLEATLMSAALFAGASQFVAAELWADSIGAAGILTLGLITATVNMRFILITASLRPWIGELPVWQTYPAVSLLTEPGWLVALRYRADGGADASFLLGSGLVLWLVWIAATVPGHLLGALADDPRRYAIDLVLPVFFAVMLVPFWRGPKRAIAWAVAGASALAGAALLPPWWHIMIGTLAGTLAAGLIDERD